MGKTVVELIENFSRIEADDSANTLKIQTYDSGSASWVTRLSIDSSSGNVTLADGLTVDDTMTIDKSVTLDGSVTINGLFTVDNTGTSTFKGVVLVDNTGTSTIKGLLTVDGPGTSEYKGSLAIVNDVLMTGSFNQNISLNTLTGVTAGSVYWQMQQRGSAQKELLMYFDAYESTSGTQTIAFPTTFSYTPMIENPKSVSGLTADTTHLTIDPGTTTTYTGFVRIWGF